MAFIHIASAQGMDEWCYLRRHEARLSQFPGAQAQGDLRAGRTVWHHQRGQPVRRLDPAGQAAYLPAVRKAIEAAHGRALRTAAGRVVQIEGGSPPKSAAIVEWDSLDDAVAFYKSKAWTDLAPQRDKATKAIRRYVVEVEK